MKRHNFIVFHMLPVLVVFFPFIWFLVVGNNRMLRGEGGIVENATVFFLLLAIGFCIASIRCASQMEVRGFLRVWLIVMILGSGYFALEEISYGQHLFGWDTASSWKELNDQDETNLHNVHAIFDQVPRALLSLAILIGGVVLPLYRHFRGIRLQRNDRLYWQWPTLDCVTVGILTLALRPVLSIFEFEFISTGEVKEALFAMFILLYCVSIHFRLKQEVSAIEKA